MDTGFTAQDAQTDFNRARRAQALSRLARRLRREPDDINLILPFDEVVEALGWRGERQIGLRVIPLDSIVGTVDRSREFDRSFRPTSRRLRRRWEGIAKAMRSGEAMPPIDVYRVGELHFVRDGHHRVSVARQLRLDVIEAQVTEILTEVEAAPELRHHDLPVKSHERLFRERVPLPDSAHRQLGLLLDKWRYAELAEHVEAWGYRAMQARGELMTREQVALAWFTEEYEPVVELMQEAGLAGHGPEVEAYMRLAELRYMLLRTHEWTDEVVERLQEAMDERPRDADTEVHRLLRSMR
jgi:hypothetical protein